MNRLNHDAMSDLAYWNSNSDVPVEAPTLPLNLPPIQDSHAYSKNNRKLNLEAIEKIVAHFVAGGSQVSQRTLSTIIAAPVVSGYDAKNPLLITLRELIAEMGGYTET